MRRRLRKLKKFLRAHWPVIAAIVVVSLVLMMQLRSSPPPAAPALVFQRAAATPTATISALVPSPTPRPTPPKTPTPSPKATEGMARPMQSASQTILAQLNASRVANGVPALTSNATLQRMAQSYADEMAAGQFLSHTDPQGATFEMRIVRSGYRGSSTAENLGVTTEPGGTDIVGLWMNSPGHRANMLNPEFRAVGIGVATGMYEGLSATYVVAEFGSTP
jgi:uncharacterized protein YkwD